MWPGEDGAKLSWDLGSGVNQSAMNIIDDKRYTMVRQGRGSKHESQWRIPLLCACLVFSTLLPSSAEATTVVRLNLDRLLDQSAVVVEGTVVSIVNDEGDSEHTPPSATISVASVAFPEKQLRSSDTACAKMDYAIRHQTRLHDLHADCVRIANGITRLYPSIHCSTRKLLSRCICRSR